MRFFGKLFLGHASTFPLISDFIADINIILRVDHLGHPDTSFASGIGREENGELLTGKVRVDMYCFGSGGACDTGGGSSRLNYKVKAPPYMANITGFLDNFQRVGSEDPVTIGFEERTYTALAKAKSHVSLIHFVSSFINAENQPVAAIAVTGWFVSYGVGVFPQRSPCYSIRIVTRKRSGFQ